MNAPERLAASRSELDLIAAALEGLHASTGMSGRILAGAAGAAASVSLQIAGQSLQYVCEVKTKIDRYLTLEDIKVRSAPGQSTLLVCPSLSHAMAMRCHELDIQFIDTTGNAYITDRAGILINVAGRKMDKTSPVAAREMTITPAALRMLFAFLTQPSMLNAPYRDLSPYVYVSTGAIGRVFETLEARGFIAVTPHGSRIIVAPELMLSEWAIGYMSRLRPKLKKFRFTAADPAALRLAWSPEMRVSAWSGEVAAEKLTQHLNPATATIYIDMENASDALPALVKQFRLRADPHGPIEVVQPFWNMDAFLDAFPTVPLPVIYADLLGSHDSRNLVVAKQIYRQIIDHVHRSTR